MKKEAKEKIEENLTLIFQELVSIKNEMEDNKASKKDIKLIDDAIDKIGRYLDY